MIFYNVKQLGFARKYDCSFHFKRGQLKIGDIGRTS